MSNIERLQFATEVRGEMRASHAGETGAVWIYRGVLCANVLRPNADIQSFAKHHLNTEKQHLAEFEHYIQYFRGSLFLPLWIIAGFLTGFIPTLLGSNWVYYTVFRVETFVDLHYQAQIAELGTLSFPFKREILDVMQTSNVDEQQHKDEALNAMSCEPSLSMRLWGGLVDAGSKHAVNIAKLV